MALQLGALRDALAEAGASDAKAQAAAEELAAYSHEFNDLRSSMRLLTWMVGGIYVLLTPALWLLLRIAAKTGTLG